MRRSRDARAPSLSWKDSAREAASRRMVKKPRWKCRQPLVTVFAMVIGLIAGHCLASAAESQQPAASTGAYDPKGKRDPFFPLVKDGRMITAVASGDTRLVDASSLSLAGILWDPNGRSIALINDTEVKAGQRIGGYDVVEIRPASVVLSREGKSVVLELLFGGERESPSDHDGDSSR